MEYKVTCSVDVFINGAKRGVYINSDFFSINMAGPRFGCGTLKGTTKNLGSPNIPVSRRVLLLDKISKSVIAEVWSSDNGEYCFNNIPIFTPLIVIALDHTQKYNAVIADPIYASLPS